MDEQRAWIKSRRKKRLRLLAVVLCFCLLFTSYPDILETLSVLAAGTQDGDDTLYVTGFESLPEDVREQTVPVGTGLEELSLPDTLEASVVLPEISGKGTDTLSEIPEKGTDTLSENPGEGTDTLPESTGEGTDTLPENTGEDTEAAVAIEGVTWESAPEYDGNTEGTYIFTAVLPGGYALWDGVSLPEITVTVQENHTDTFVQALLDRIAALPDIEEYFAAEPDMEDGEAYAEWEEKLYEYVEEALAIREEYELLTEEQQAQIPEAELARLTAWMEFAGQFPGNNRVMLAAAAHSHCVCGGSVTTGGHSHDAGVVWEAWDETGSLPTTAGNYYLTKDITVSRWEINADIKLCLNRCTVSCTGTDTQNVIIRSGGSLSVCDCRNTGSLNLVNNYARGGSSACGVSINNGGTFFLYSGSITVKSNVQNENRSLIGLSNGGKMYLYGGSITVTADQESACAVKDASEGYIYGGDYTAHGKEGGTDCALLVMKTTYLVGSPSFFPASVSLNGKGMIRVKEDSLAYTGGALDVTAGSDYVGYAVGYLDDSTKPKFNVTSLGENYKVIRYPVIGGIEYILNP